MRAMRLVPHIAVFLVAALLLALGMDRELAVYDEGVILTGAMRVLAGDVPHGDFYANYGPGAFYVVAALFKLFGTSAIVERAYDTLVRAGIVTVCYALAAGVVHRGMALAVAAAVFCWMVGLAYYGYPMLPVALLTLVAAALVQPALIGPPQRWRLAAAGACVAAAALIRYDAGFIAFVALGAVFAIAARLRASHSKQAMHASLEMGIPFVAGTSVVFLGATALYLLAAPLGAMVHDIFVFSIPNYAPMRSMPFPSLGWTLMRLDYASVYTPLLACLAAGWSLFARPPAADSRRDALLITVTVIAAAFYLKGLVRPSPVHLIASVISSLVVLGVLVVRSRGEGGALRITVAVLALVSFASAAFAAWIGISERLDSRSMVAARLAAIAASQGPQPWCRTPPQLATIQCLLLDPDREQAAVMVAESTSPDERIFVGLTRHDKIFVNDVGLYFATARMPATRWHHFDPGLQTSERIQRAIIDELESQKVRYVVLESSWDDVPEPNRSSQSSGVFLLDEYLRRNYRLVRQFGQIYVVARAGS
jgi:hypothetical protein